MTSRGGPCPPPPPRNKPAINPEIWGKMKPKHMIPDEVMMVREAKAPVKLDAAASVYCPTATVQFAKDALMVRC